MICHNCKKTISETARFCKYCGVPVQKSEEPAKNPAPAKELPETAPLKPAAGKRRLPRALVSLLLFLIFTAGFGACAWSVYRTCLNYNIPYREKSFASLEQTLTEIQGCPEKISDLEARLITNSQEALALEEDLDRHRILREEEILNTLTDTVEIDYDALFATEPFSTAYTQYINELLTAFRRDMLTDSWLRTYNDYTPEYGSDELTNPKLWIYIDPEDSEEDAGAFHPLLSDPAAFCSDIYTDSLSDHAVQNEHLYVTGMDMLNELFHIPGYVLDAAVFVKAYGGNPNPEEMSVPGWNSEDYEKFWTYTEDTYQAADHAIWEDYDLSAADFDIDWNALTDEAAYYSAYEKFMDAVAPGLSRYDMAQYLPDDDYYGGVRYELTGEEASLKEIAAAYIADNPSCLEALNINPDTLPSSYDDLIAEGKKQLEELEIAAEELEAQKTAAEELLSEKDYFQQQLDELLAMREDRRLLLTAVLCALGVGCIFLFFMAASSFRRFMDALR